MATEDEGGNSRLVESEYEPPRIVAFLIWRLDYNSLSSMHEEPLYRTLLGYVPNLDLARERVAGLEAAAKTYVCWAGVKAAEFPQFEVTEVERL